uniref:ABC transporter permease n=1 Tax=Candidatus Caldatribacterium saccharofermentans TaxID=1454753 RepID=A0A7V4TI95_9BACT
MSEQSSTSLWVERKPSRIRWSAVLGLLVFYVVLCIVFSILSPFFLTLRNFSNIASNMAYIGIMAAVQTALIIGGVMDLSMGASAQLAGVLVGILYGKGWNIWVAVLFALLIGLTIGAANAVSVTRIGINSFIATLGMLNVAEGIALVLTGGLTVSILVPQFQFIGMGAVLGIPFPIILMASFFIVFYLLLAFTPFGRTVYAVGGNPVASKLCGINNARVLTVLFILSGLAGATSGILVASMLGAAAPAALSGTILTVIASVILGGTSLSGGSGSVWGTLLGVLILGTLTNGLVILNVSSFWQEVTQGLVLLAAVGIDQIRQRRERA